MIPIHQLLSRIRWDADFGAAEFIIGYYDRLADHILLVPFSRIIPESQNHYQCKLINDEGETIRLPLHRVREVYRDGVLIWSRDNHAPLRRG